MRDTIQKEFDKVFGSPEKYNRFKELQVSIGKKRFTVRDVNIPQRWIMHWHEQGLLFGEYLDGKWRKFDLVEYIWLKMIVKMREFKIQLPIIKKVKEALQPDIDFDKLFNNDFSISLMASQFSDVSKEEIKLFLQSDEIKKLFQNKHNLLKHIILDCLIEKEHSAILINRTGEIFPFKDSFINLYMKDADFLKFFRSSYVSISVTDIVSEFIAMKDIGLVHKELSLVTDDEAKIFEILMEENIKSVTIRYKDENIDLIEVTKNQKIDKRARLVELIMNNGYQDIKVTTQKGEITYCENTRKIKFLK